jgi:sporulation protein YlmC with PRC-barrel domain
MDIAVDAEVHCADGLCGRSTYVVLDPISEKVTHIVVAREVFPHTNHLVSTDLIVESTPQRIVLRCTKDELAKMEPFIETEFLPSPKAAYQADPIMMWPYSVPESAVITLEHEHVPPGELAVRRGAQVQARDGHVGRVDEFLVNPTNGHITHLIMREGHLWGQKNVTIPVSEIDHIDEDTVHLKMDKREIELLPAIPIRGHRP